MKEIMKIWFTVWSLGHSAFCGGLLPSHHRPPRQQQQTNTQYTHAVHPPLCTVFLITTPCTVHQLLYLCLTLTMFTVLYRTTCVCVFARASSLSHFKTYIYIHICVTCGSRTIVARAQSFFEQNKRFLAHFF